MLSDSPIALPEDDELNRAEFARALANALILPSGRPSFVAAIEGGWGSGKTSVLNMVQWFLGNRPADSRR
jgi:predicted KAP-like P-loop ATPase